MILAVRFLLTFTLLLFVCTSNANTGYSLETNLGKDIIYREIVNESICGDQIRLKSQQRILKKHNLINNEKSSNKYAWLSSPYDCTLVSIKNQDFYIYHIYDKNTPTYVFILLNKTNKEYLLAVVDRDYTQDISNGRVGYMGTLVTNKKVVRVLQNYIANQTYGGVNQWVL